MMRERRFDRTALDYIYNGIVGVVAGGKAIRPYIRLDREYTTEGGYYVRMDGYSNSIGSTEYKTG